jgi:Tol biopolymer transport system component
MTNGSSQDVEPSATKGDWIVYTAWATNMPFLWKLPIGGGTPIQISNLQAQSPVVSPDGKSVLCQIRESYDGRWRYAILSLANGKVERELPDLPVTDVRAQWEQNGKTIDYVDNAGTRIWTKSLSGGEAVPLKMTNSNPITDFSWNGDGTKLAFTTSESKEDVILFHKAEKK